MNSITNIIRFLLIVFIAFSCEKFVEIDPPRTDLIKTTVFTNDATANAAVIDLYYQQTESAGFASGGNNSISLLGALSADELVNGISWDPAYQQFNENAIQPDNSVILTLWSDLYKSIYKANAVLEGLASSKSMTVDLRDRLRGEALFMRAFSHFYLVNLYGDVPLITITDYSINKSSARTPVADIYRQIIDDLQESIMLLKDDYAASGNERVRVNKFASTALLARIYLYTGDWVNAEARSTELIENPLFSLGTLDQCFLKNNSEAIWQLMPNIWNNAWDAETFMFYGHQLSPSLLASFEDGDNRKIRWIEKGVWGPFDYAVKYKDYGSTGAEYSTVLRLAEQYLIRAEARAMQDKITGPDGAQSDINMIRNRAGLDNTNAADRSAMLIAIEHERRIEFFTEWGHRWLDVKRWNKTEEIIGPVKNPNWQSTDVLYPIPEFQILNSSITQNDGY